MTPAFLRLPRAALDLSSTTSLTLAERLGVEVDVYLRADANGWSDVEWSYSFMARRWGHSKTWWRLTGMPSFRGLWDLVIPQRRRTTHIRVRRPERDWVGVHLLALLPWARPNDDQDPTVRLEALGIVATLYALADGDRRVRVVRLSDGTGAFELGELTSFLGRIQLRLEVTERQVLDVLETLRSVGILEGTQLRSHLKPSSSVPEDLPFYEDGELSCDVDFSNPEVPEPPMDWVDLTNQKLEYIISRDAGGEFPSSFRSNSDLIPKDPTSDLQPGSKTPSFAPAREEKKKQPQGYPRVQLFLRGARGRLNLVSWAAAQVASRFEDRQLFLGSPSREDLLKIADRLQQTQDHRPLPDRSAYPLSFFEEALQLLVGERVLGTEGQLRLRSSLRSQGDPGELSELLEASLPLHEAYQQRLEALEEARRAEEAVLEQVSTPLGELVHLLRQAPDLDLAALAEALQVEPEREEAEAHLVEQLGRVWVALPADYRRLSGLRTVGEYLGFLNPKAGTLWREVFGAEPPAAPLPEVDLGPEVVEVVAKLEALRAELEVVVDPLLGLTPEQALDRWLAGEVRQVDLEMKQLVRAGHLEELDRLQAELSGLGGSEEELGRLVEKARWFLEDRRGELERLRTLDAAPVAPIRAPESSENGRDRPALSSDRSAFAAVRGTLAAGTHELPPLVFSPPSPPPSSPGDLVQVAALLPTSWAPSPPLEGGTGDRSPVSTDVDRSGTLPRSGGGSGARGRPFRAAAVAASPPGVRPRAAERSLPPSALEPSPSPSPESPVSRAPALPATVHARALGVVRGLPTGALAPPL